jgi:predicted glycosyltransferase involved in capsule biosynthesis
MCSASLDTFIATIIIPIRALEVEQREIHRLKRLLSTIPSGFEVVVVDDGSPFSVKRYLKQLVSSGSHYSAQITLVSLQTQWRRFSFARARNRGVKAAKAPVVIFHDVDFIGCPSVYERIKQHVLHTQLAEKPQNFFCIPVAFLTEEGTDDFIYAFEQDQEAWCFRECHQHLKGKLQFLVQGSSAIVSQREDLLAMGGHDESFKGHGAEDFELLHRLGRRYPIAPLPPEYLRNMGSGDIKEYRGFRAYFSLYGLESRQAGTTLVHLWHPKRSVKGYYRHKQNFDRLRKTMESVDKSEDSINIRAKIKITTEDYPYTDTSSCLRLDSGVTDD